MPLWGDARRRGRRLEAAVARAIGRLDRLGPNWHIVDRPGGSFLAIGPGGVFAVTVIDHGRSRVLVVGDVVQIKGERPAYVAEARVSAERTREALSSAVDVDVPMTPVLIFVGSGVLSFHGLPQKVLVATDNELDRLLIAGGARLTPTIASQLAAAANDPATWA